MEDNLDTFSIQQKMEREEVTRGQRVVLLWSGTTPPKQIEEIVSRLNGLVGSEGKVSVEHEERIVLCT